MLIPQTLSAGYVVPLAIAACAADHTSGPSGLARAILGPDDGARWFFQGVGTYRMIKRHAAAMRAAMHPEEAAALLVPGLEPGGDLHAAVQRMFEAREREGLA